MRPELTEVLALDCEMVLGLDRRNKLAQVAIANEFGQCVYNYYVKQSNVANYRTNITGITPNHLRSGKQYQVVRREVADIIRGRILVGHGLDNDLRALGLGHPEWNKRDTAYYFRTQRGFPSLKNLAREYIGWIIQENYHNAVEDAKATMLIYKEFESEWEASSVSEDDSDENDSDESDSDKSDSDSNEYYYDTSSSSYY